MAKSILAVAPSISFKLHNSDATSLWPPSERFPKSVQQALEFGWLMDNEDWDSSPDERTRTGIVRLHKTVNGIFFQFAVPARAKLEFGNLELLPVEPCHRRDA
jgi:hypothetical protein